jgi:hypothetical protein
VKSEKCINWSNNLSEVLHPFTICNRMEYVAKMIMLKAEDKKVSRRFTRLSKCNLE